MSDWIMTRNEFLDKNNVKIEEQSNHLVNQEVEED